MGAPAVLDLYAQQAIALINDLGDYADKHVSGAVVTDGDSTQASGANATLNFDADVTRIVDLVIDGVPKEMAVGVDIDADAGTPIAWGATSGKAVVFAIVIDGGAANDGAAWVAAPGDVAATAAVESPTDAVVEDAIGHSHWIRVADVTIVRTGDTTLTFTADHTVRPVVPKWRGNIPESESALRSA